MNLLKNTQEIIERLNNGEVGILPTDTVYGVVARASDQTATSKINILKQRDGKPGTVVAASIDQLVELGLKRRYLTAVEQFWPGAVSVIVPCGPELDYLHLGKQGIAVQIPDNTLLQTILAKTGPLITSSANISDRPVANTVEDAFAYFGNAVDFYVDGGDLSSNQASTIVQVIDDYVEVIRQGAVDIPQAE